MTSVTQAGPSGASQSKPSQSSSKASKKQQATFTPSPELMDQFTRQTEQAQNLNLTREHEAQLGSQQSLSQGRIAALLSQLQTQLFSIWNEVWLQRQKVHDEAFKGWLKLLTA